MISRWSLFALCSALLSAGCCCPGGFCNNGCGPRGQGCGLFCQPYEQRMAASNSYNCGSCNTPVGCGNGGIKGWLRNQGTCCQGCGDRYWGEWISDPPDCCDPCDQCGGFTGGGPCCRPGLLRWLSRAWNGYRYCPGECGNCGLGGLGSRISGCRLCGGMGCDACGGGGRGMSDQVAPGSVLDENWDPAPSPKPTPGKPIHKADTPHSVKVGAGRMPGNPAAARPASYEPWR